MLSTSHLNTNIRLPSPACGRGAGGEGDVDKKSSHLLNRAKNMRTNQTDAEKRLWFYLRAHRYMGLKFKRQKPIGHFIVDFVCFVPKLIIEVDGGQHLEQATYDNKRDAYLKSEGFVILRFWNNQVLSEIEAVLESIRLAVISLSPAPLPLAGEGVTSSPLKI